MSSKRKTPTTKPGGLTVRRAQGGWELVPSRCAVERTDDMLEVHDMIEAGETELAREELRYLLQDCPDFLEAHQMLGQIALDAGDTALARGHFGYVYDLVRKALPAAAKGEALPYALCANRIVHNSGKSLAMALHRLGQVATAIAVGQQLLSWDASDPLGVRALLESWRV